MSRYKKMPRRPAGIKVPPRTGSDFPPLPDTPTASEGYASDRTQGFHDVETSALIIRDLKWFMNKYVGLDEGLESEAESDASGDTVAAEEVIVAGELSDYIIPIGGVILAILAVSQ